MPKSRISEIRQLLGTVNDRFGVPFQTHYGTVSTTDEYMGAGDRGHYGYPNFPADSNIGGAFSHRVFKGYNTLIPASGIHTGRFGTTINYTFTGNLMTQGLAAPAVTGNLDGSEYGAEAFAKMKPTKPEFDLATSIGELRELPSLVQMKFRNALQFSGGSGLMYQFGVRPLVQEAVGLYNAQQSIQHRLKQLLRDNGRPVRRALEVLPRSRSGHTQYETLTYGAFAPVLSTYFYTRQPKQVITSWFEDRVWASARFKYFLPEGPRDIAWKNRLLRELYGLRPRLSTIYNLMPWSWLIDWFSNVGDVIDNCQVTVADRLAAPHFYVMRQRSGNCLTHCSGGFRLKSGQPVEVSGVSLHQRVHKSRVQGSPFGFAVSEESLNGTQLAILGALGLSKL